MWEGRGTEELLRGGQKKYIRHEQREKPQLVTAGDGKIRKERR